MQSHMSYSRSFDFCYTYIICVMCLIYVTPCILPIVVHPLGHCKNVCTLFILLWSCIFSSSCRTRCTCFTRGASREVFRATFNRCSTMLHMLNVLHVCHTYYSCSSHFKQLHTIMFRSYKQNSIIHVRSLEHVRHL